MKNNAKLYLTKRYNLFFFDFLLQTVLVLKFNIKPTSQNFKKNPINGFKILLQSNKVVNALVNKKTLLNKDYKKYSLLLNHYLVMYLIINQLFLKNVNFSIKNLLALINNNNNLYRYHWVFFKLQFIFKNFYKGYLLYKFYKEIFVNDDKFSKKINSKKYQVLFYKNKQLMVDTLNNFKFIFTRKNVIFFHNLKKYNFSSFINLICCFNFNTNNFRLNKYYLISTYYINNFYKKIIYKFYKLVKKKRKLIFI